MSKKRYANTKSQALFEKAIELSYPLTFEKDGIGGSAADAFNAGYEGRKGGLYRYFTNSSSNVLYQAGKKRRILDKTKQKYDAGQQSKMPEM